MVLWMPRSLDQLRAEAEETAEKEPLEDDQEVRRPGSVRHLRHQQDSQEVASGVLSRHCLINAKLSHVQAWMSAVVS